MIQGISHLTFLVKDLEKSAHLFISIFEATEIYSSGECFFGFSREKFFLINGLWICLMEGDSLDERTYNHVAFAIPESDFDDYAKRIESLGLEIRPSRPRVAEEGRSLYFYDYDNHLFELHAGSLETRLQHYTAERT